MAPSSRPGAAPLAPTDALPKPQPSNGVLTTGNSPTGTISRKKAKRRQKQAAKQTAARGEQGADYADEEEVDDYQNGDLSAVHNQPLADLHFSHPYPPASQFDYDNDADLVYSDEEGPYAYETPPLATPAGGAVKKSKKKKKGRNLHEAPALSADMPGHYPSPLPPPPPGQVPRQATISEEALRTVQRRATKDAIWDTSSQEERLRIKEFWLNLEEEKRKSLVKIEKEAVLRKMKEQQKHSCSCTVCGRKRTAIEEELEVLYDAYYEELEQFANHGQPNSENGLAAPVQPTTNTFRHPMSRGPPDRTHSAKNSRGRIEELADDEEEDLDEENDDDLSDASYDDDYTSTGTDEVPPENTPASDFFSFGKSLTVKGGILTVADDLLKNDGQKFIDMMEQLAERRMQREEDAALGPYRVPQHQPLGPPHGQHSHPQAPLEEDDYSDEEEDDEDYDSQAEELEDEDDEMDTMTEEQRMEEGRRMFQIFAARMFEQRVLTAYREKVARDRQDMLIAELEGEKDNDKEREAKKQRDALKKKQKKAQQKAAKDQKAQQKAEAEAKAKADEEARLAEQKRKREEQREEQRRRKEEERKKAEDDKAKKEAEKQRRQQLERDKQQEQERKAREAKAEEKRRKEDAKQKERENREAKEKEAREKREQAEHDKRMKEDQARREAAVQDTSSTSQLDASRRVPPPAKVALPPGLVSVNNVSSPQDKIASPTLRIASAPVRQRDGSAGATQRSILAEHSDTSSKQSTLQKPPLFPPTSQPMPQVSRTISHQGPHTFTPQALHQPIPPPPGMPHPSNSAIPGFSPVPMSPYGGQVPMLANAGARSFSGQQHGMYAPSGPHMAHRPGFGIAQHAGLPPGISPPIQPQHARAFPDSNSASYISHSTASAPGFGPPQQHSAPVPGHSRQPSGSSPIGPPGSAQPIGRPNVGAIKRPASVKPNHDAEVDDLSTHLGSSALLDDDDGPDPLTTRDNNHRISAGLSLPLGRTAFAEPPMRPGFSSPFDHTGGGFGGLAQRLPPNDSTWTPRVNSGQFGPAHAMVGPGGWGNVSAPTGSGWGTPGSAHALLARGSTQRLAAIRKMACDACRTLANLRGGTHGGYNDVEEVLNQMQQMRGDMSIQRRELEEILDTEDPDEHNGGGHFVRMGNRVMHVSGRGSRSGAGLGLGEIGSPLPGLSAPNLPNLGRF